MTLFISLFKGERLNRPGKFIVWFRNETTLLVLWQPPISTTIFTHYRVTIDPQDAKNNAFYVEKDGEPASPGQGAFKGLVPGRAYNISVQTVYENEVSLPMIATYRTVPLKPLNVTVDKDSITSNSFRISWKAPSLPTEFDKYQVSLLKLKHQPTNHYIPRTVDPVMWYEFKENLESGETYEINVKTVSETVTSWPAIASVTLKNRTKFKNFIEL